MKIVYRAAHSTDAHLMRQLLEQEGMTAFVNGGLLEGGAGELPMNGLVTVSVADEHEARALEVVREWQSMPVPPDDEDDDNDGEAAAPAEAPAAAPRKRSWAPVLVAALLGAAFGAMLTWTLMRKPMQVVQTDFNADEVADEREIYEDGRIVRVEIDHNRDGQIDEITHFDGNGRQSKGETDQNFDGFLETTHSFKHGSWRTSTSDFDADGEVDYRADGEHGVIDSEEWRDAKHNVVKRVRYDKKGWTARGEYDSDGDGKLDTERRYDARGEIVSSSPIVP